MSEVFNVALAFIDRNVREGRGSKVAIECADQGVSYEQLLERTNRVGNALCELGVQPKDRVLLLLQDTPEFLYCFFGALKVGAVAVPANTYLRAAEYEYLLNDSHARVVFASEQVLPQLRSIPPERLQHLPKIVVVGDPNQHELCLRDLMAAASPVIEAEPMARDDVAFWLYSSGSTGPPKACVHRHRDMVVCSELYAQAILRMNGRDRCYSVARLFFAYGLGNAGYFPLYFGGTSILSPGRPTPASIFEDIERYRPTLFFSVPSNYAALLTHRRTGGQEFDLSSIRYAVSAGEALPASLYERFKDRFGIEILDAWGSTETLHMAISNRPGEVKAGSSGRVIPGYEARIVDENGSTLPVGSMGNLLIRGDSTCTGYWNQPERTKASFGDWFHTGDKYRQDSDGYFWYAGRSDDLFKVKGQWVSPVEVESVLVEHVVVREAAVVPCDDGQGLTRPAAYVVVNPGVAATDELAVELQDWVGRKTSGYKRPYWVEYLTELPKTATGKVKRFELRKRAQNKPCKE